MGFTVISNKVLTTAVLELVNAAGSEGLATVEMLFIGIPAVAMLVKLLVFEVSAVSVSVVRALRLLSGRIAFLFFQDPSSAVQVFNSKSSSFRTNDLSRWKN